MGIAMFMMCLRYCFACCCCLMLVSPTGAEYAGSAACKDCHSNIYALYIKSGHPYKLQKIDGKAPVFPARTSAGVPQPPEGFDWPDISYLIGGFGWKARFMDQQGYILTGEGRQYNLANPEHGKAAHWVAYGGKEASSKPYTCGSCHTTGWVKTGPDGPHQDGLPGIHGTWAEPGVTCEACHGPSADHVVAPMRVKPTTAENCNSCHIRGEPTRIDASSGLIRHHEQYEDLLASPHQQFTCGSCHNPHQSTRYKLGGYQGDKNTCMGCHEGVKVRLAAKKEMACHSCHMPLAVKSALATTLAYQGSSVKKGDLRSHIHRITTDPDWKMFTDDGKHVRVDDQNRAFLTVDHACLSCHTDQTMDWARERAKRIH